MLKRRDHGGVAAYFGLTNSLSVGNAKIYGMLLTGPGGSALIGPQGSVGSIAFVENPSNNGMIQPGYSRDDMDPFFPDVTLPSLETAFVPGRGNIGGTNYDYVLDDYNYWLPSLSLGSGPNPTMIVTGRASMYIPGNVSVSGRGSIVIAPGGSLTLYAGGLHADIGGNGIINQTDRVSGFRYYGLRSNTSLSLAGNGTFIGTIYAPNAHLTLGAGGSLMQDFVGACVSKIATIRGHFLFHFDEDLARTGPLF